MPGSGLLGFATAKAIGCNARRLRQKRRAREAWRTSLDRIHDWDFVVMVKVEAQDADFPALQAESQRLAKEAQAAWAERSASS